MNIQIKLLTPDAKIPTHGSEFAAGYDLYTTNLVTLQPGERHLYKTGISTAMPNGVYGRIAPRSGLAYKSGIETMAGVIDSDYRGEIGVLLVNLSDVEWTPTADKPIAQIIFEYHNTVQFEELEVLPDSVRASNGFGSTDIKGESQGKTKKLIEKWSNTGLLDVKTAPSGPNDPTLLLEPQENTIVDKWKQVEDNPTPQKYETIIRAREKTIQPQ